MSLQPRHLVNAFLTRREPFSIVHFVTDRCNARCPHCFVDRDNPAPRRELLTLDEIRRLTRTVGRGLYNVNVTGGEPFLRDDLAEIVSAYCEHTPVRSVVITTNGTLPGRIAAFLDRFARSSHDVRVKISLSIDHDEARHDELRGVPGAFRSVLDAYHAVHQCPDPRVAADVALTVTPYNCKDIMLVHDRLKSLGITRFTPILMRASGVVQDVPGHPEVTAAYAELARRIGADRGAWRSAPIRHRIAEAVRGAKNDIFLDAVTGGSSAPGPIRCHAGRLFGVIGANGDIFPCEPLGQARRLGNARDAGYDFLRIWQSGRTDTVVRDLRRSGCKCSYECAWSVNMLTAWRLVPRLLKRSCRDFAWNG